MHPADPPVANTRIPAAWHAIIVAATVVAPQPPPAIASGEVASARPCRPIRSGPSPASRGRRPQPDQQPPGVERHRRGTAPVSRMAASAAVATSTFCGYAMPWLMSVDSSATTGVPSRSASATSGAMARRSGAITDVRRGPSRRPSTAPDRAAGSSGTRSAAREAGDHRDEQRDLERDRPGLRVDPDDLLLDVLRAGRPAAPSSAVLLMSSASSSRTWATCACSAGRDHRARLGHVRERQRQRGEHHARRRTPARTRARSCRRPS